MCKIREDYGDARAEEAREEGREEGRAEERVSNTIENIRELMSNLKISKEDVHKAIGVTGELRDKVLAAL